VKRLAELLHHVLPEHHAAEIEEIVSVAGAEVGALIVDVDLDGRITALSDAVSEALALPPEAIVGRGFFTVFSSGDMPADAASALIDPPAAPSTETAPDAVGEAATLQPLVTTLHRGDDGALSIAWEGMHTFDDLGGINGRKLFGTPRPRS
jgi:PAS domain-containing protein